MEREEGEVKTNGLYKEQSKENTSQRLMIIYIFLVANFIVNIAKNKVLMI